MFLLKDEGTTEKYTDYDFIYEGGRIDNWIAFYNNGTKLKGTAVKSIFTHSYSKSSAADEINTYSSMLLPISSEDIALIELNSGIIERDLESLFFSVPEIKNFQQVDVNNSCQELYLINDGAFYNMSARGGGSFYEIQGNYEFAPCRFNGLMNPILFDKASNSLIYATTSSLAPFIESSDAPISCNGMNVNFLWGSSINFKSQSTAWLSYCLLQQTDNDNCLLISISGAYNFNNSNPIKRADILPATLNLVNAEKRAVNADYGVIYFVKDNQLWKYLVDSQYEEAILDLPAGEEVTFMQHIAYPNPMSNTYGADINCFAIATYSEGKYKVWLHEFDGENLKPLNSPTFEGEGRVACINYVKDNTANFLY